MEKAEMAYPAGRGRDARTQRRPREREGCGQLGDVRRGTGVTRREWNDLIDNAIAVIMLLALGVLLCMSIM